MNKPRGLKIQRKLGESITINDIVTVTISEVRGKNVKFTIEAPEDFKINRSEPYKDAVELEAISRDLATPSPLRKKAIERAGPSYIKYTYGKYGGSVMRMVPSYMLSYILNKELKNNPEDLRHINLLIAESERREHQKLEGENGYSEDTIH